MNSNYASERQTGSLPPRHRPTSRVVIVGGGASGTLMALHLAGKSSEIEVILVEKGTRAGRGLAYGTACPEHVVNVVPARLSAFADDPGHFVRWLQRTGNLAASESFAFVPRQLVGEYLGQMVDAAAPNLTIIQDEATALNDTAAGVEVSFKSSPPLLAVAAILATGHDWIHRAPEPAAVPSDVPVTILGTGLSMIDRWLGLRAAGHRGPITAVSRRGLLPHAHAPCAHLDVDPAGIPVGKPVSAVLRWARRLAAAESDWRSAVDGIRPFVPHLWQSWTTEQRSRFLRHARPYWDIHRHRVAPALRMRLDRELRAGTLRIERSRKPVSGTYVFDCRGLTPAWDEIGAPLIGHLLRWGDARPDALGLGLDVTTECKVIDTSGTASEAIYAIGPLTRGRFWEIEAIPEIRAQCHDVAERLILQLAPQHAVARALTGG